MTFLVTMKPFIANHLMKYDIIDFLLQYAVHWKKNHHIQFAYQFALLMYYGRLRA